jgi:hypothetical protein
VAAASNLRPSVAISTAPDWDCGKLCQSAEIYRIFRPRRHSLDGFSAGSEDRHGQPKSGLPPLILWVLISMP